MVQVVVVVVLVVVLPPPVVVTVLLPVVQLVTVQVVSSPFFLAAIVWTRGEPLRSLPSSPVNRTAPTLPPLVTTEIRTPAGLVVRKCVPSLNSFPFRNGVRSTGPASSSQAQDSLERWADS